MPPLSEPPFEVQQSSREERETAFRISAVLEAINASGRYADFLDAMNRVLRNYHGKLPDGIHDAFDRYASTKDPQNLATVVIWLKSESGESPTAEPTTVASILKAAPKARGRKPKPQVETPAPADEPADATEPKEEPVDQQQQTGTDPSHVDE